MENSRGGFEYVILSDIIVNIFCYSIKFKSGGNMKSENTILTLLENDFKIIEEKQLVKGKDIRFKNKENMYRMKYFMFLDAVEVLLIEKNGSEGEPFTFRYPEEEDHFLFRIMISGSVKMHINGNEKFIKEKQALIVETEPSNKERWAEHHSKDMVILILNIQKQYLKSFIIDKEVEKFLSYFEKKELSFEDGFIEKISGEAIDCLNKIISYREKVDLNRELYMYGKIIELVSLLIKKFVSNKEKQKNSPEIRVEAIKQYIEENYFSEGVLEKLPKNFYTNKVTLLEEFKNITGETFHTFVKRIKLEKAYEMLVNTRMNISEVVDLVGYKNYGYFSKIFFEQFNLKPSEVRKMAKNK